MKAWELTRDLLRHTQPIVRNEEEQTWEASERMAAQDTELALFWKSQVPGSAAPENLMAGALQSLENKGYRLQPYEDLLKAGMAALEEKEYESLYVIDMKLRTILNTAQPDPAHPSQKTVRYTSWDAFDQQVTWPSDVPVNVRSAEFTDKTRAAWMAQLVGAAAGTALEGYSAENIQRVFGAITDYPRQPNTYNDDITFEIAFLDAWQEKGPEVKGVDICARWTSLIPAAWSAEAIALANIRRGLVPPATGTTGNPFDEWIGAQMRGVICGMVAPGMAREAARLAWLDGEISHSGNGILGEVFNAVLAARAFTLRDARELVTSTVALFADNTEYGAVVQHALETSRESADWQSAWAICDARYEEYNWIHTYPNAAAQVIALWFGEGDFDRTLEIICNIGHDVDCNAAQILCVLAIQQGSNCIDERWSAPLLKDDIVTYMRRPARIKFDKLVSWTTEAVHKWHKTNPA